MLNSDDRKMDSTENPGGYAGDEKREYERVLFNEFLGIYTIIETKGLRKVKLIDISTTGCRFETGKDNGKLQVGDEWAFRFYFTKDTYLPALLRIKHRYDSESEEEDYIGYGAAFDGTLTTYPCLRNFIEIIYCYATHAIEDKYNKEI